MYKPPFQINSHILSLSFEIQSILGELKSHLMSKPDLILRKQNRIKTIQFSLAIEGNSLSKDQITAILENKRVIGPKNQIQEVLNAVDLYKKIAKFKGEKEKDFLLAHQILMNKLIDRSGQYRFSGVGVFKSGKVSHVAPPHTQVPKLMYELFSFLADNKELPWLLKACIFHYEVEFIHPFLDGNGRMGRFWQQVILMRHSPIFEFISVESLIHKKQAQYYSSLEECDRAGESTKFIEFSLHIILETLKEYASTVKVKKTTGRERLQAALTQIGTKAFTRQAYMKLSPGVSTATASRDLGQGIRDGIITKSGDKALTSYVKSKLARSDINGL